MFSKVKFLGSFMLTDTAMIQWSWELGVQLYLESVLGLGLLQMARTYAELKMPIPLQKVH